MCSDRERYVHSRGNFVVEQGSKVDIALVGAGAVGCAVSAHWAGAGKSVLMAARDRFAEAVAETRDGTISGPVQVILGPEDLVADCGRARWIGLSVKAPQTASTKEWISALAGEGTTIVVLQNGVEHRERVAEVAPSARVLPVVVECPSTWIAPGRSRVRGPIRLIVPDDDDGREFADFSSTSGMTVETTPDFRTAAWKKLAVNVAGGALTAIMDQPLGIMRIAAVADLALDLVRECVAVGRAEGAALDERLIDEIVQSLIAAPEDQPTSMLTDRRAGKRLEVDARNGAVVRFGRKHGIPTPINAALWVMLEALSPRASTNAP